MRVIDVHSCLWPEPPTPSSLAAASRWQRNYKSLYAHRNIDARICENASFIFSSTTEHRDSKSSRCCFKRAARDTCVTRCVEALIRYTHAWRRTHRGWNVSWSPLRGGARCLARTRAKRETNGPRRNRGETRPSRFRNAIHRTRIIRSDSAGSDTTL